MRNFGGALYEQSELSSGFPVVVHIESPSTASPTAYLYLCDRVFWYCIGVGTSHILKFSIWKTEICLLSSNASNEICHLSSNAICINHIDGLGSLT